MIILKKSFYSIFLILILLNGCCWWKTVLDINAMPTQVPQDLQAQLVWALWNLDSNLIDSALKAGADPKN